MLTRRNVLIFAPAFLTSAMWPNGASAKGERSSAVVTNQAISLLNRYRRASNFDELIIDPRAELAALNHSREMALLGELTHSNFKQRLLDAQIVTPSAENIAVGQQSVSQVLESWKKSRGHRNNLLGAYNRVGLAVARNSNSRNKPYWTMILSV